MEGWNDQRIDLSNTLVFSNRLVYGVNQAGVTMPTLSAHTRRKLKYLPVGGSAPHNVAGPPPACWNWALSGFGPNAVSPDSAFSYVAQFIQLADVHAAFQQGGRLGRLNQLRVIWQPYYNARAASGAATLAFAQVTRGILKLAVEANGLAWSDNATPYMLCMHYEDGLDGSGELRAPNWTHWWLQVDGGGAAGHNDAIEAFPRYPVITLRRPEYAPNDNERIYLTGLHATHVAHIDTTLDYVVTHTHNGYPHNGAWVGDLTRVTCSICLEAFTFLNRRHHCRCCGAVVCDSCSPELRAGMGFMNHPNNNDGAGPQRVCLYCE